MSDARSSGEVLDPHVRPLQARASARDLGLLAVHLALLPVAALAPQARWLGVGRRIAAAAGHLDTRAMRDRRARMVTVLAGQPGLPPAAEIEREFQARRVEQALQYLRAWLPGGFRPELELRGGERLEQALSAGRGAILWVAPCLYASLCVKMAFRRAGHPLHHLTSPDHGASRTRWGRKLVNPLLVRPERRELAEAIPMGQGDELRSPRALLRRLAENRPVSIACIPRGRRRLCRGVLGAALEIPTGAPSLALASGAPLFPVFCARRATGTFEVILEAPLAPAPGRRGREAVADLVAAYAARIEAFVLRDPASSLIWHHLD